MPGRRGLGSGGTVPWWHCAPHPGTVPVVTPHHTPPQSRSHWAPPASPLFCKPCVCKTGGVPRAQGGHTAPTTPAPPPPHPAHCEGAGVGSTLVTPAWPPPSWGGGPGSPPGTHCLAPTSVGAAPVLHPPCLPSPAQCVGLCVPAFNTSRFWGSPRPPGAAARSPPAVPRGGRGGGPAAPPAPCDVPAAPAPSAA